MHVVYSDLEYFSKISGLLSDLPDICRSDYIKTDISELGYFEPQARFASTEKYKQRIIELNYTDKPKLIAHLYVRHMGDLYGGKLIGRKVPGSGKAYQFDDRPALIKTLDAKLTMDILDESLLAFDMSAYMFNDMLKKVNESQ